MRWHKILAAKGWSVPHWPVEWGGTGWNITQRYIYDEEFGLAGAPALAPFGPSMCASVLLRFGTPQQKHRFLPRIREGDDFWVQGYSRAGRRLRPGVAEDPRRTPRRPLPRQRPEDLDHAGPVRRLDLLPGAHRRHGREAAGGHQLPAHRHDDARHHRAPADPDGRRPRGERDLLRRRQGAGGEPGVRGEQGLDGGQVPARPRAHGLGRGRRLAGASWPR